MKFIDNPQHKYKDSNYNNSKDIHYSYEPEPSFPYLEDQPTEKSFYIVQYNQHYTHIYTESAE